MFSLMPPAGGCWCRVMHTLTTTKRRLAERGTDRGRERYRKREMRQEVGSEHTLRRLYWCLECNSSRVSGRSALRRWNIAIILLQWNNLSAPHLYSSSSGIVDMIRWWQDAEIQSCRLQTRHFEFAALSCYPTTTPCPEKEANSFLWITLTNVDAVSLFLAWTIPRTHFTKKIENLFLILSHRYVMMT